MTTEIRGGECEIRFPKPAWLRQESVVNVLGIAGVDNAKIERCISAFPADKMSEIESVLNDCLACEQQRPANPVAQIFTETANNSPSPPM